MRSLFAGLFDDAALFPPGNAPMADAVPAHRNLQARLGDLVGPFVVPADRLGELTGRLGDGPALGVSVIAVAAELPAAVDVVAAEPRLALAGVEVSGAADAAGAAEAVRVLDDVLPAGVRAAVEVPRAEHPDSTARDDVLDVLADTRYHAKLRTGGLREELFPSPAELAGTLSACAGRGVAVKCTAGRDSAVRHRDPATGFVHHGFLNVLVAAGALASGEPPVVAAGLLGSREPSALVTAVRALTVDRATGARSLFTSFGTCSIVEPVDDLVRLGLLTSPERTPA